MFGSLGGPEIILIFVVALIVFGPKRLPEIGRKAGGWVREFRKATGEFRSNIEREIGFDPVTGAETTKKVRRDMWSAVSAPIREIAEETWETAREGRKAAAASFGAAGALDPDLLPPDPRPPPRSESVPRTGPGSDRGGLQEDQPRKHREGHPDSPGEERLRTQSPAKSQPGPESPGHRPPGPESPVPRPPGPESPGPSPGIPESPGTPPPDPESPGAPDPGRSEASSPRTGRAAGNGSNDGGGPDE